MIRLLAADKTIITTDEEKIWKDFFNAPSGTMTVEYCGSDGVWRNLHPSDEEAAKLTSEQIVEMGKYRGMPVFWWGRRLGAGGRPHTLTQVEEAAKALGLTLLWDEPVLPGDWYLAARNTGAQLLTCAKVDHRGWVQPVESAYAYDWSECVKVKQ